MNHYTLSHIASWLPLFLDILIIAIVLQKVKMGENPFEFDLETEEFIEIKCRMELPSRFKGVVKNQKV